MIIIALVKDLTVRVAMDPLGAGERHSQPAMRRTGLAQQSCYQTPFGRNAQEVRLFTPGRRPRGDPLLTFRRLNRASFHGSRPQDAGPVGSSLSTEDAFCKKLRLRSAPNRLRADLAASDTTVESRPNGGAEREAGAVDLAGAIATSDGRPTPDCPREQLAKSA